MLIKKTRIPQDKFVDLVNLVLTTTCYTFNSQFYRHATTALALIRKQEILLHLSLKTLKEI